MPWHAAPCAVDEDGDEWWERERGWRPEQGESLLEHDDAVDEGGSEGDVGSRAPLELTWWRSRIPRTAHHGGGGRATLRSTATHPSATPSRATPTSCSALASTWTCERETERDRERAREDKDGSHPRVGIRPRPRGDKVGDFFRHPRGGFKISDDYWYRLM
jgi:hypothetical protein